MFPLLFLYHHSELPNQAHKCHKIQELIGTTIYLLYGQAEYIQHLSFQLSSEISLIKRLNFHALLLQSQAICPPIHYYSTSLNLHTSNLVVAWSFNYLHTIVFILSYP